jgi:hypothetical protein
LKQKANGVKSNSIPQEKKTYFSVIKVNPPKENLHLMTNFSSVKSVDIGKMIVN